MPKFEYEITRHTAETFNELVYYCSEAGQCSLDEIPTDQTAILKGILNERGWKGWELLQIVFGKNGLVAFWKRPVEESKG